MRICLLGDFSEGLDEGYKNYSHCLAEGLEKRDRVVRLNIKKMGTLSFWRALWLAKPEVIHAISQPTGASLVFTRLMKFVAPKAKSVISALRLDRSLGRKNAWISGALLKIFRPDLMLVQSRAHVDRLNALGLRAAVLPGGVDLKKFRPCDRERKIQLRRKYHLDPARPVVLHVGHLIANRNVLVLGQLVPRGIQVVVVGSTYLGVDRQVIAGLAQAGVGIYTGYQPQVEEFYQLADCYAFPLVPGDSLSLPLSILEAMATNIQVVTTRFCGVEELFPEGEGIEFAGSPEEIIPELLRLLPFDRPIANRVKLDSLSWEAVVDRLRAYYREILDYPRSAKEIPPRG